VESDAPPERTGAPECYDEEQASEEDLEEAEPVFTGVAGVQVEEEGER